MRSRRTLSAHRDPDLGDRRWRATPPRKRGISSPTSLVRSPRDSSMRSASGRSQRTAITMSSTRRPRMTTSTFNVALIAGTSFKDIDLSVRLKAVAGEIDRGGGLIWRARDKSNYYICRFNPLEDNYRVYKVENGKRTMFKGEKTPGDANWHTLRVTMVGTKITCYFDGKKYLEAEDATFAEAGMIGLWSKADAQSYFDKLTVNE